MNTYFIYNNIDSRNMGVVLTTTPVITRPPKRYKPIYIDGVDGYQLEDLGYSGYDKELEIGLQANADIDAVMSWLSGSGHLTIWNEPNKYYDVEICDQIDYESLLIFHKAKIKFLCQPYKYALEETVTTSTSILLSCNCIQLPRVKITGTGNITVKHNNTEICNIVLSNTIPYLILDADAQDAFYNGALANRSMSGNFVKLYNGENNITTVGGTVTEVQTTFRKRWL